MSHDRNAKCLCVKKHSPIPQEYVHHHIIPLYLGGPETEDNKIWLCPTAHMNVHELIRLYHRSGEPSWSALKHFSPYIRGLAKRGLSG